MVSQEMSQGLGQVLLSLLPMLPWEGPPLPQALGIRWPWVGLKGPEPEKVQDFFRGSFDFTRGREITPNQEETEIVRDPGGSIVRLIRRKR